MNISDIIIIYLACGAPFGVYYFLQNRKKLKSNQLWMKSFFTVFVWFPYAFFILNDFATNETRKKHFAEQELLDAELNRIQKEFLQVKSADQYKKISIFEMREVLERYAGLTRACHLDRITPADSEKEIFRISLRQNSQTAANCLHRRNLKRLRFHQALARQDFLQIIMLLKFSISDTKQIRKLSFEMIDILNDKDALEPLQAIFATSVQSSCEFPVKDLEKEVWTSKEQKPLPSSLLPTHLAALTAPTIFKKD